MCGNCLNAIQSHEDLVHFLYDDELNRIRIEILTMGTEAEGVTFRVMATALNL
jgi:hypothetical protein